MEAARQRWRRSVFWCRARYLLLVGIVLFSWAFTTIQALRGVAKGQWFNLIGLLPIAITLVVLTTLYRRQFRFLSSPSVGPLPPEQHAVVAPILADMGGRLGATVPGGFELLLDRRRLDPVPGISRWRGRTQLLLPVGFFQVLADDPQVAYAMLAHEVGHIRQGDVNAGAWVAAYAKFFRFWSWPVIAAFALNFGVSMYAFAMIKETSARWAQTRIELRALETRHAEAERRYVKELRRYQEEPSRVAPTPPVIDMPVAGARPVSTAWGSRIGWAAGGLIIGGLFGLLVVLVFLAAFRAIRRWSENAADLGAALVVGPQAIIAAITRGAGSLAPPARFGIHPTAAGRAAHIASSFRAMPAAAARPVGF
jgi:hypothetical protein